MSAWLTGWASRIKRGGKSIYGDKFGDEITRQLKHTGAGILSMVRACVRVAIGFMALVESCACSAGRPTRAPTPTAPSFLSHLLRRRGWMASTPYLGASIQVISAPPFGLTSAQRTETVRAAGQEWTSSCGLAPSQQVRFRCLISHGLSLRDAADHACYADANDVPTTTVSIQQARGI
jgi:hypothetical protein